MFLLGIALALANCDAGGRMPFAFNLLRQVPFSGQGNTLVSPFSVATALSGLAPGMGHRDQDLLLNVLSPGESAARLMRLQKDLMNSVDGSVMQVANSVWVSRQITAKVPYLRTLEQNLNSEVNSFSPSPASLREINAWVSNKTKGRIPQILNSIKPDDALLLINAIAFDGKWKTQFDPQQTYPQAFHAPAGAIQVPMMHIKGKFPFQASAVAMALKMPYHNGNFSMLLLLPAGNDAVKLIKTLTPEAVRAYATNGSDVEVTVAIPKFKFSSQFQLEQPLKDMGLGRLFQGADFSGISDQLREGRVSRVVHKTFIDVDEKGTKAAAATGVMVQPTMVRANELKFVADRPFAFFIIHEPTQSVVFAGVVNDPTRRG